MQQHVSYVHHCALFSSSRFIVWLVSCAHVFELLKVVIVTLPTRTVSATENNGSSSANKSAHMPMLRINYIAIFELFKHNVLSVVVWIKLPKLYGQVQRRIQTFWKRGGQCISPYRKCTTNYNLLHGNRRLKKSEPIAGGATSPPPLNPPPASSSGICRMDSNWIQTSPKRSSWAQPHSWQRCHLWSQYPSRMSTCRWQNRCEFSASLSIVAWLSITTCQP